MAKDSPLAAGSSKTGNRLYKGAPKEVLNNGKNTKSEQGRPEKRSGGNSAGDMYKKPGKTGKGLASSRSDQSSGQSLPTKCMNVPGGNNTRTYSDAKQNAAYNNEGPRPTKFIN